MRGVRTGYGLAYRVGFTPWEHYGRVAASTIGALLDREEAGRHLTLAITTGFGEARNALVARSADAVIAVGGEFGTLSEIALALKMGIPVIGMGTWELGRDDLDRDPIIRAETPGEALEALRRVLPQLT